MSVFRIALVGGPGGGKSKSLSKLKNALGKAGYKVIIADEVATSVMESGISPADCDTELFQGVIIERTLVTEKTISDAANACKQDVVVVYDRGIADCKAYMPEDMYDDMLRKLGVVPNDARDQYDLVVHLVTPAFGAESHYSSKTNKHRSENVQQAREKDLLVRKAWSGHHHLVVIDNSTDFTAKVNRVKKAVFHYLSGEEYQRKWLIKKPSNEQISQLECVTTQRIVQVYASPVTPDMEERVRKIGEDVFSSSFSYSHKAGDNPGIRRRVYDNIDYSTYLARAAQGESIVKKMRSSFYYKHQYFQLDRYLSDGANGTVKPDEAILEIDLVSRGDKVELPPWVEVISEITADRNYANKNLARKLTIFEKINKAFD